MLKIEKKHEPLSTAKALVGLLVLAIVAVLFYKFLNNQDVFFDDIEALRNYVVFTICVAGFLIGLLYFTSQTTHKTKAPAKAKSKTKSSKKKK